jgi:ubiquitin-like modifier-activating enzyme 5
MFIQQTISDCVFLYIFVYRYLLGFGQVSYYLGYSALTDFFPTMHLRPNLSCGDNFCQQRQADVKARPPKEEESIKDSNLDDKGVTHEDNVWGMWS